MINKDKGIIIYLKKIKDNDLFLKILSKKDNIISGMVYGGNSSKKKSIYQIGHFIEYNIFLKNLNNPPSIKAEIIPPFTSNFLKDKFKSFSLLSTISLLNLSIIEGQKVNNLYLSIESLFHTIKLKKNWIVDYCEWLLYLLQMIGYQIDYRNNVDFKYYNLETLNFEKEDYYNNNVIEFPHELFAEGYKYKLTDIKIIFLIFEKIFQRNHLNNINSKMPINFINFKELILKELKSHLND